MPCLLDHSLPIFTHRSVQFLFASISNKQPHFISYIFILITHYVSFNRIHIFTFHVQSTRLSFVYILVALKRAVFVSDRQVPSDRPFTWRSKLRCCRQPCSSSLATERPGCSATLHPERWSRPTAVCSTPRRCGWPTAGDVG